MIKEREENRSNRKLWDDLYNGFNNSICKDCYKQKPNDKTISFPQPIQYIGPQFFNDDYRLTFVGIETYTNDPRETSEIVRHNPFNLETTREKFYKSRSPFWAWIRKISQEIVAKDKIFLSTRMAYVFERIAWTNLLKCQCRSGNDLSRSTYEFDERVATNCIQKAKWIFHEIERIDARNIIVFSGRAHEYALARIFLNLSKDEQVPKFDYTKCDLPSEKIEKWKDRDLFIHLKDANRRFIVTNHPQGTPANVREEIIKIIKNDLKSPTYWKMPHKK